MALVDEVLHPLVGGLQALPLRSAPPPPYPPPQAGEGRVGVVLELLDLLRRPTVGDADQRVGDGAFGEIIELPELLPA